jgi:hypothetical protein
MFCIAQISHHSVDAAMIVFHAPETLSREFGSPKRGSG